LKWLKNIFGGKKAKEESASLQLAEINTWLEEREKESGFVENLEKIYCRIEDVAEAFSKDISALEIAGADDSTPPKLLRAGLAARGEVVKQLASLREKLMPPKKGILIPLFSTIGRLSKGWRGLRPPSAERRGMWPHSFQRTSRASTPT